MERTDPAFRSMQSLNWSGVTTVGEESAHIHHWHAVLQETLPRIRDNALSPSYFKTFCTHLASDFLQRYDFGDSRNLKLYHERAYRVRDSVASL